jgi:2'-hydroxyisoflavone reductase
MARRLLILGGGRFVGYALVSAAQSADWSVTAFNRGRTSPPPRGTGFVQGDRYNSATSHASHSMDRGM